MLRGEGGRSEGKEGREGGVGRSREEGKGVKGREEGGGIGGGGSRGRKRREDWRAGAGIKRVGIKNGKYQV